MTHLKFEPRAEDSWHCGHVVCSRFCGFRMPPIPEPKSRRDDFILVFTGIERTSPQAWTSNQVDVEMNHGRAGRFNSWSRDHGSFPVRANIGPVADEQASRSVGFQIIL